MKRSLLGIAAIILMGATPAHAWNCTTPNAIRVQVPNGTTGTGTGDGLGQVVVDNGLTFECEILPTTTPSTSSSTSSANSAANSASNSSASSNQSQSQKQGQTQVANGGQATATGGQGGAGGSASVGNVSSTSSVSKSGNSTLKNVGNSSNTNTLSATGGNQSQSSTATATGNGNNSNDSSTEINEPRQVASAIVAPIFSNAPCSRGGFSASGQASMLGLGFSTPGKNDKGCEDRATAILFYQFNNPIAAARVLCQTSSARRAGLSEEDCERMTHPVVSMPEIRHESAPMQPIVVPAPQVVVNIPPPAVTLIPAPAAPAVPDVAKAVKVHKTLHQVCKCTTVTNDTLPKHTGS